MGAPAGKGGIAMRKTWPIKLWHVRRDMKDVDDALDDLGTNLLELHNKGLFVGAEANEILNRLIDFHTWINEVLFIPNTTDTDDGEVRWNLDHRANLAAENDGWDRVEAA
jgi:hypothetical protein